MNIILIGLRGSGKSELGKIIGRILELTFIDIDQEIEKEEGKSIRDMVKDIGWEYFRQKEREMTMEISQRQNTVIGAGGGTIIDPQNAKALKKNGKIIYLHVSPEICAKRISKENKRPADSKRPALTAKKSLVEEMRELYNQRDKIYRDNADIIFDRTNDKEDDARKIINLLK